MPTGEWEMYSAEIEGKNALVFVRTDLIEDAPNPLLPHYFTITLRLRSRRPTASPTKKKPTRYGASKIASKRNSTRRGAVST